MIPEAFEKELAVLINRYGVDSDAATPDFILAKFVVDCLFAWAHRTTQRDLWFGENRDRGEVRELTSQDVGS